MLAGGKEGPRRGSYFVLFGDPEGWTWLALLARVPQGRVCIGQHSPVSQSLHPPWMPHRYPCTRGPATSSRPQGRGLVGVATLAALPSSDPCGRF